MPSYRELRRSADARFHEREVFKALRLYLHLLRREPQDHQVRLHVADCLVRLGQRERAMRVLAALALSHLVQGRTLPALLTAKALDELQPGSTDVFETMATLYGAGSGRTKLDAPPSQPDPIPEATLAPPPPGWPPHEVLAQATAAAAQVDATPERVGPLPPLPILSDLGPEDLLLVLRETSRVRFPRGAVLLREGALGASFYLVAHGSVRVTRHAPEGEQVLADLHQGAILGEMALVLGTPRSASAVALEDVDAIEVSLPTLERIARRRPGVARALERFARQRLVRGALARTPVLRPLYPEYVEQVTELFAARTFEPGEDLLRVGDPPQGLLLLTGGDAEVIAGEGEQERLLAAVGPGDLVGEMSLLDDQPVSATVRAVTTVTALLLSRDQMGGLLDTFPTLRGDLASLAETRRMENMMLMGEDDLALEVFV